MTIVFLLAQVAVGVYFIMSGVSHFTKTEMVAGYASMRGLPVPKLGTIVSGAVLALGGLGVLLGVFVDIALWALALFLVAAAFGIHHFWKDQDPMQKMGERVNFMKNLALAASLLLLLGTGNWVIQLF